MKKKPLYLFVLMMIFALLVGCNSSQSNSNQQETSQNSTSTSETNQTKDDSNANQSADDYPNKPIKIVIPVGPGVGTDAFVRVFAKIAEKYFEQPIIVENKAGGNGAIAIKHLLDQPADGYTFLSYGNNIPLTMASGMIPYTIEDIQPVASLVASPQAIVVPANSKYKTIEDLLKYGKENPGEMQILSTLINSVNHVFALKVFESTGIEGQYIPFDSGSEAARQMRAGHGDAGVASIATVSPIAKAGKNHILAHSGAERLKDFPDVPTLKELGYEKLDDVQWRDLIAKPGIPQKRLEKFNEILAQVLEDPEWKEYVKNMNYDSYFYTGDEFEQMYNRYYESAKELLSSLK